MTPRLCRRPSRSGYLTLNALSTQPWGWEHICDVEKHNRIFVTESFLIQNFHAPTVAVTSAKHHALAARAMLRTWLMLRATGFRLVSLTWPLESTCTSHLLILLI